MDAEFQVGTQEDTAEAESLPLTSGLSPNTPKSSFPGLFSIHSPPNQFMLGIPVCQGQDLPFILIQIPGLRNFSHRQAHNPGFSLLTPNPLFNPSKVAAPELEGSSFPTSRLKKEGNIQQLRSERSKMFHFHPAPHFLCSDQPRGRCWHHQDFAVPCCWQSSHCLPRISVGAVLALGIEEWEALLQVGLPELLWAGFGPLLELILIYNYFN